MKRKISYFLLNLFKLSFIISLFIFIFYKSNNINVDANTINNELEVNSEKLEEEIELNESNIEDNLEEIETNESNIEENLEEKEELDSVDSYISSEAVTASERYIKVSGKITWIDSKGNKHDARNITVKVIDDDIFGVENVLATTLTDSTGNYSATVSGTSTLEGKNDIFVRIYSEGGGALVSDGGNPFNINICDTYSNFEGDSLEVSYCIGENIDYDYQLIVGFRIHQALNLGAEYFEQLEGERLDTVTAIYHFNNDGTANFDGKVINISKSDKANFDVILHEYAHYVASFYDISNSPGGQHLIGDCLNEKHPKADGIALAWSEGFANYFSMIAQYKMKDLIGDFDNFADSKYYVNEKINPSVESPTYDEIKGGESSEMSIAALLFDLADPKNDDNIDYGDEYVWNLIKNSKYKNVSEFINALYNDKDDFEKLEIGHILSKLDIAPEIISPSDSFDSKFNIPSISYLANGGKGISTKYENDNFQLAIYNNNKKLILKTEQTNNKYYTPSDLEWFKVVSNSKDFIYLSVIGYETTDFTTGPYYSNYIKINITNAKTISLNEEINDNVLKGEVNYYKFTPNFSGLYRFESFGNSDTFGELFSSITFNNEITNRLAYSDNDGSNNNFMFEYNLEADKTYYIRIKGKDYSEVSFNFKITNISHTHEYEWVYVNSSYHVHKCNCEHIENGYEYHEFESVPGNRTRKVCNKCGYMIIGDNSGNIRY